MTSFSDIAKAMQEKSKELDDHLTHLKKLNEELRDRSEKILVALEKLVGCTKNSDKSCTQGRDIRRDFFATLRFSPNGVDPL